MICVHCGGAIDPATKEWNSGSLCTAAYSKLKGEYSHPKASMVEDMVKIHALLWYNLPGCLTALGQLHDQLGGAKMQNHPKDTRFEKTASANYVKLSRALEFYEGYCWFPPNRILLTGILSSKDFFKSQKLGFAKDSGAQGLHGEQSHRLQWHAIMFYATLGFQFPFATAAKWSHSPLEIYYELTQGAAKTTIGRDAWGYLMDSRNNEGWGNPDNVVRTALEETSLPMIREAIKRRADKIGGPKFLRPADALQKGATVDGNIQTEIVNACIQLGKALAPSYNTLIGAWRKGEPVPQKPANPVEKDAAEIFRYLVYHGKIKMSGNYDRLGKNMLASPVTKLTKIDGSLVKKSRMGFNAQYSYSVATGAAPKADVLW